MEASRDLRYVHSSVNQSQMMRILIFCAQVSEVVIICANVQYIPPYE